MAEKNDPSIYDDRSTIGNADELDEYGVWVKSEPQDLSSSLPDIEELPDIDAGLSEDSELPDIDAELSEDLELPDIDAGLSEDLELPDFSDDDFSSDGDAASLEFEEIPETSDLPPGPAPAAIDQDGFTEVSMDDFLDSVNGLGKPDSIDFGDLDNTVPEIEPLNTEQQTTQSDSGSPNAPDLSTQLLMKIADELSSIKKELSSLKTELAVVRGEPKPENADAKGGFFDEEDDEKIALTGDELDNILNTANFTEEAGSDEGLNNDLAFNLNDTAEPVVSDTPLSDQNDIISEDPSINDSTDELNITFDESDLSELDGALKVEDQLKNSNDDFDISLDSGDLPGFNEEPSELDALREEGAFPITPAPDDTSYLEEDPLASATDEQIDLSGAVIDEPDLSSHITENPISEPAIDNISIDLDMEEHNPAETAPSSDDFVFETEETMEIPVTEEPFIDDNSSGDFSPPGGEPFSGISSSATPEIEEDISFGIPPGEETLPDDLGSFEGLDTGEVSPALNEPGLVDFSGAASESSGDGIPSNLKQELKTVLSYMDQLLESLPEDKIEEFAKSEYFDTYKKLFEELGLV
jgi:hypothetical protein